MEDVTQDNLDGTEQESALAEDAVPLCPNCLEPCDPLDNYCTHCGSNEAINPLASYMPFVDIRFNTGIFGKLWRKCWNSEIPILVRCLYIGIAFLFYPFIFCMGLPFLFADNINNAKVKYFFIISYYLFLTAIIAAFIVFRYILTSGISL